MSRIGGVCDFCVAGCVEGFCALFLVWKYIKSIKLQKSRKKLKKLLTVSVEDDILMKRSREQTSLKENQE